MDKHKDKHCENQTEQEIIIAVIQLLHNLFDKDEALRKAVEASLNGVAKKNADVVMELVVDFRNRPQKWDEKMLSILFQLVHTLVSRHGPLRADTIDKLVKLCVEDLMKTVDHVPSIQKPILDTLVLLSRMDCDIVIVGVLNHLSQGQVVHFMVLHGLGELASANTGHILKYLRKIFSYVIPTMEMVKTDFLKQAYSFAIGRFCEAITENLTETRPPPPEDAEQSPDCDQITDDHLDYASEVGMAYDVIVKNWLYSREAKVCTEVLVCLGHMFPLLRSEKVSEQICDLIPNLLALYRKTIDRLSITTCLAATIQTSVRWDHHMLDRVSPQLIATLFDLICVNPDYEKPQTLKGHYEVFRCFDLLTQTHRDTLVMDMVLTQLQSSMERDRIKSLQLLVHFCSTREALVKERLDDCLRILKVMMLGERMIRMKMHLLKTIIAFAQQEYVTEKLFIRFVIRFACEPTKAMPDLGTEAEQIEFQQTCNHSLFILASAVGTVDDLLKRELLNSLMQTDYITAVPTIAKCLAKLFEKGTEMAAEQLPPELGDQLATLTAIPTPKSVFVRCLVLLDNPLEKKRATNLLLFLKSYAPIFNKHVQTLWSEKVKAAVSALNVRRENKEKPLEVGPQFLLDTIRDMDEGEFAEAIIEELLSQQSLYVPALNHKGGPGPSYDFKVGNMSVERGNLFKLVGMCLSQVDNEAVLDENLNLLLRTAQAERLDKNAPIEGTVLQPIAQAYGFAARKHFQPVVDHLIAVLREVSEKKGGKPGVMGILNFLKDHQREAELYKMRSLVLEALHQVVQNAAKEERLIVGLEEVLIEMLLLELTEVSSVQFKRKIIQILLNICQHISETSPEYVLQRREKILAVIPTLSIDEDTLQLLPVILTLATFLMKMNANSYSTITNEHDIITYVCDAFFARARQLKTKFESTADDVKNSFIAGHLNASLPELLAFVRVIVEQNPTPSCLDVMISVVEKWTVDNNSEVRICASHVINAILDVYIKTMQIGGEAPSKFNQTGLMVGKTVPRCIDSNATVRQISIDILRKIFEISCIYDTLTIPTADTDWVKDLARLRQDIVTHDSTEILKIANNIAQIIGERLATIQYNHFCSTLVSCVNDPEQSSAIGAAIVLKFFVRIKGQVFFHNVTAFVQECLGAIADCKRDEARISLLKSIVSLTKQFPVQVCNEMLQHDIPYNEVVVNYWKLIARDPELTSTVIENFLATLNTSCLYETAHENKPRNFNVIAAVAPLKIFYALREILLFADSRAVTRSHFEELFAILLTSLACYMNTVPPVLERAVAIKGKGKFSGPTVNPLKAPAQIILEIIKGFLDVLDMEQLREVFNISPDLGQSNDLYKLVELIAPLAVAVGNTLGGVNSAGMRKFVHLLSRCVSSTYEPQRIIAVALFAQLLTLTPAGDLVGTVMLHLHSALNDPNLLARGCAIRGLGNLKYLNEYEAKSYMETSLMALMNGLDVIAGDRDEPMIVNIPLESLRGLCQIINLSLVENAKVFHINLAIRIRPFWENDQVEIREKAISLFGQLCDQEVATETVSDSVRVTEEFQERINKYLFPLLLHLGEKEERIRIAARETIRKCVGLMKDSGAESKATTNRLTDMIEANLLDYGQLEYDTFVWDLMRVAADVFSVDVLQQAVESVLPFLKSHQWPELRGAAVVMVGVLGNRLNTHPDLEKAFDAKHKTPLTIHHLSKKVTAMIKDDNAAVRVKAALALGHLFANI